jgi:ADP-heptose:LPS heptosyltransferase
VVGVTAGTAGRPPAGAGAQAAAPGGRVLVARLDSMGDVLISGPAIRAVAAHAGGVVLLCGPRGRSAAGLLPGVDHVVEWVAPWIDPQPSSVTAGHVRRLVDEISALQIDSALILTSFHQSPLPLALLLRLAGVRWTGAICHDYPGSLLDLRHRLDEGALLPEPERALHLARAAGFHLPKGDDGRLEVKGRLPDVSAVTGSGPYAVVHPGASVPARACPPSVLEQAVRRITAAGLRVLVTGSPAERSLTGYVAGDTGTDLGGATGLRELAAVLAGATAVVAANTGPAHLAAAVRTPVVSLFAPTVPARRWAPYGVPVVILGDQNLPCRGCRAQDCPVPGHPCLSRVTAADIAAAVAAVAAAGDAIPAARARRQRTEASS